MIFYTTSGSAYEVDLTGKRIRRLRGSSDPTPRQGTDGEWREYVDISPPTKNLPVLIAWSMQDSGVRIPCTLTTPVTHVASEEN
jgi:hypothetical protein